MPITPAELTATVAVALGMPTNSVKNYDRQLMEAGLRTKKGHGRGTALMGAEDAAVLLAAIAASDEIGRAADCVNALYAFPFDEKLGDHTRSEYADISLLSEIIGCAKKEVDTFGKALVAIMHHLVGTADPNHYFGFEVSIAGGEPYAVGVLILKPGMTRRIEFSSAGDTAESIAGGLRVTREIIGAATAWVADIVAGRKRSPANSGEAAMVMPQITTFFLNIREAYEKLCERIEEELRREEARIAALRASERTGKKTPAKSKKSAA